MMIARIYKTGVSETESNQPHEKADWDGVAGIWIIAVVSLTDLLDICVASKSDDLEGLIISPALLEDDYDFNIEIYDDYREQNSQ